MKIKSYLVLFLVPPICILLILLTVLNYKNASEQAKRLVQSEVELLASQQSDPIFDKLRHAEAAVRSLAFTLRELRRVENPSRTMHSRIVKGIAESSREYFGVWALWEPNAFDRRDKDFINHATLGNSAGSANAYWLWEEGDIVYNLSDNYRSQAYYVLPKEAKDITIIPPYRDEDTANKVLMTTIAMPVMDNSPVLGVVGIDIELDFIHSQIQDIRPYGSGYLMVISDKGTIVAQPFGEPSQNSGLQSVKGHILQKIQQGEPFNLEETSIIDGSPMQSFYIPVKLDSFESPWYFMIALPLDKVMAESRNTLFLQLGLSMAALFLLIALVLYAAASVSQPLQRIAVYAKEIAAGNCAATVEQKGFAFELKELQAALQSMLGSLLDTMHQAEQGQQRAEREAQRARQAVVEAEQAKAAAEEASRKGMQEAALTVEGIVQETRNIVLQVTENVVQATEGTRNQQRYVTDTAAAMLEMSTAVGNVARNAVDAHQTAEETRQNAVRGAEAVLTTVEAITDVNNKAQDIALAMDELGKQAARITSVTNVITDIADQTNLLALNAAIEAARAGSAGRGFAVVADEVRKLAEKTMLATQEVGDAIRSIQQRTGYNISAVEEVVRAVEKSTTLAKTAGESLDSIVAICGTTASKTHSIATASEEQSVMSEQIFQSTEGIKLIAGENSQRMAHVNNNIQAIDNLTRQISDVLKELKTL